MRVFFAGTPYASHERTLIDRQVHRRLLTYADGKGVDNTLRKWQAPKPDDFRTPKKTWRHR